MAQSKIIIKRGTYRRRRSDIFPIAETIVIDDLDEELHLCSLGVEFFSDETGTFVQASAGTVAVAAKSSVSPQFYEDVPDNIIDATSPTTIPWAGNVLAVQAVPAAIGTATHWRINVSQSGGMG